MSRGMIAGSWPACGICWVGLVIGIACQVAFAEEPGRQGAEEGANAQPVRTQVSQQEMLAAYKEVLTNAQSAVKSVESTTKLVLWLVGAAFALLTLEGFGALSLLYRAMQGLERSMHEVREINNQARVASDSVAALTCEAENTKQEVQNTKQALERLDVRAQDIGGELTDTVSKVRSLKEDLDWYKRLMVLDQIRLQVIRLFQSDEGEWADASNCLAEILRTRESVVRWYVTRLLGEWAQSCSGGDPRCRERIRSLLAGLQESDVDPAVRSVAAKSLEII